VAESAAQPLFEEGILQASSATHGEQFGASVEVRGDQVLVGAPASHGGPSVTWDFETGDLRGWTATGNAFELQPTFGDNSRHRPPAGTSGYSSEHLRPQQSQPQGLYYVSSFERRPGNGREDARNPDPRFLAGGAAGDRPVGTLTSQPFLILGPRIWFRIGGGCDHLTEYVELLVDGFAVARSTGSCRERLEAREFETAEYVGRAAQIRIVDISTAIWGHVSADDFRFSWNADAEGFTAHELDWQQNPRDPSTAERAIRSGAAYIFLRQVSGGQAPCADTRQQACQWSQHAKLLPSDRRPDMRFGASVAFDESRGYAIVGAPAAPMLGLYKDLLLPASHVSSRQRLRRLPASSALAYTLHATGSVASLGAGNRLIDYVESTNRTDLERRALEEATQEGGAVYLFARTDESFRADGELLAPSEGHAHESVKLIPPDLHTRDFFGSSVAAGGGHLVAGSPKRDGAKGGAMVSAEDVGGVYVFDTRIASVGFLQKEFRVLEDASEATILLTRADAVAYESITVEVATSDLTAAGVGTEAFEDCMLLAIAARSNSCGDYERTNAKITFAEGDTTAAFSVRVVDNACREHYPEYVQLTLSVPGSFAAVSEKHLALLRIDDQDFHKEPC